MIVQHEVSEITRSGISGERKFGISMNAKMYDMMSAKLYQDRIGSVVREVCSNAWDGMKMKSVASGNPIEPFKVTLPTNLLPHFTVEDFGVGMEDEMAQDLYSTLGMSTKERSNDQIGAFGLGSKSPFAVTDTFTVENTYEGITHYYLCFKDESGLPSLVKTGEKVEDRPNGVKVIIPAPYTKFDEYVRAINKQLFAMEPKPIITNGRAFKFSDPVKVANCEFGYILSNCDEFNLSGRSVYGRMGMVIYPIDTNQAGLHSNRLYSNIPYNSAIILNFPIGALDPLPSREGLTYDKRTIANISEQYSKFCTEYKKTLLSEINDCKLPLEAYHKIKQIHASTSLDFMQDGIKINGYEINNKSVPDFFPSITYKYSIEHPEVVKEAYTRWNGTVVPREVTAAWSEKKTQVQDKFVYEDFSHNDTRLNIIRDKRNFNGKMSFQEIEKFANSTVRILIMDEIDPKYRVARLKSALDAIRSWNETLRMVFVNPHCDESVDRTDFKEFIDSFEKFQPGITKSFVRLSEVKRPEVQRQTFVKDSTTAIEGLKVITPGDMFSNYSNSVERYVCLDDMAAFVERTETIKDVHQFEDRAFYINCTRNVVDLYKDKVIADFCKFGMNNKLYFFIVRKGGASQIKWLEENGVVEFSKYVENRMKDAKVTEDFRKYNSSRLLYNNNSHAMFLHDKADCLDTLYKLMVNRGEYIHPMFVMRKEIKSLASANALSIDDDSKLLVSMKDLDLISLFEGKHDWAGKLDFDMSTGWDKVVEEFKDEYPLAEWIFSNRQFVNTMANGTTKYNRLGNQYISDYNKLKSINATIPLELKEVEVTSTETETQINVNVDAQ